MGVHHILSAMAYVPPKYSDLSKASSDLLNKDFFTAGNALEVKTKAPNGVAFKVTGNRNIDTNAIAGELEGKFSDPKNGVTFTQAWSSTNALRTVVELENQIAKGLKVDLTGLLLPATAGKSAFITATYKQPSIHTRAHVDVLKGPTFTADAAPSYTVSLHGLSNFSAFSAAYYHRVNNDIEVAAKSVWDKKSSNVALECGTKVYLDNTAFVKAKVNNAGILVLGYTQALRPGVKAGFGVAIDTQKLSDSSVGSPAHKLGTSLTFES